MAVGDKGTFVTFKFNFFNHVGVVVQSRGLVLLVRRRVKDVFFWFGRHV